MKYNITQAAKVVGVSRSTLNRDIKNGKVSTVINAKGKPEIQIAELERVYGTVTLSDSTHSDTVKQVRTPENGTDNRVLETKIESLEQQLARERETVSDLRRRLDDSEEERRKKDAQVMALLTDQRGKPASGLQGLFGLLKIKNEKP